MRSFDTGSGRDSVNNSDSEGTPKRKSAKKAGRKWGDEAPTEADMDSLNYSTEKPDLNNLNSTKDLHSLVDEASMGSRNKDGLYEVKDWEFDVDNTVSEALKINEVQPTATTSGSMGALGSLFSRLTGSKVLSETDLKPVLDAMKQHLMKKNVAKEIADKVCEGVGEGLIGKKVGGFQSKEIHCTITPYLTCFYSY
jgi:signal recognition particle receptor subunit alpha